MRLPLNRIPVVALAALVPVLALACLAPIASAARYVPGEVIVKYHDGTTNKAQASVAADAGTGGAVGPPATPHKLKVRGHASVAGTVRKLERDPRVEYATPNYVAHASATIPNDPGFKMQWNLNSPFGINMPEAWDLAKATKNPGGKGVVVAVLDTGVAYQRFGRYRRAPDLDRFAPGYDYVDDDHHPNDENGHGTHVAGTIAQTTGNKIGTAGIAYRAKIMPVRVLDADGAGDTYAIARGIRYAVRHKAKVINMSLEFDGSVRASQIPDLVSAMRYARQKGVVIVAAAGNQADTLVAFPARARQAIAVSATTIHGCLADYSNTGSDVDISAPGGGRDAALSDDPYDVATCRPNLPGQFIFQQTFTSSVRSFGLPRGYEGTSMASPHVAGVAALLIASGKLGRNPAPAVVERRLYQTARDLGPTGPDRRYGAGLLDAGAALR